MFEETAWRSGANHHFQVTSSFGPKSRCFVLMVGGGTQLRMQQNKPGQKSFCPMTLRKVAWLFVYFKVWYLVWCKFDLVDVSKLKSSTQTQQDLSSVSTTTPKSCYQVPCDNYLQRKQQQRSHQGIFRCLSAQFNSRKQSESALCDQPACQFSQGWSGESAVLDQAVDAYTSVCTHKDAKKIPSSKAAMLIRVSGHQDTGPGKNPSCTPTNAIERHKK